MVLITQENNNEPNTSNVTEEKVQSDFKSDFFDWIEVIVSAIVVVVILFTFILRVATIEGRSMQNTLFDGEKVIISNLFYEPKAGDIVVISRNKENTVDYYSESISHSKMPIIKRVIATEGQTVDIDFDKGKVYVDNKLVDDSYTKEGRTNLCYNDGIEFPLIVKEGCVFVLGDNRNDSLDSRSSQIGQVDTRYILGRVIIRIFPFNKIGGVN
ncbi:MAG: signal peptidase I [Clostridia bacterium]|nr:signal peptidase I [Clostridia bacterium]